MHTTLFHHHIIFRMSGWCGVEKSRSIETPPPYLEPPSQGAQHGDTRQEEGEELQQGHQQGDVMEQEDTTVDGVQEDIFQSDSSECSFSLDGALRATGYDPNDWNTWESSQYTPSQLVNHERSDLVGSSTLPVIYEAVSPAVVDTQEKESDSDTVKELKHELKELMSEVSELKTHKWRLRQEVSLLLTALENQQQKRENDCSELATTQFNLEVENLHRMQHNDMVHTIRARYSRLAEMYYQTLLTNELSVIQTRVRKLLEEVQ